MQQGSTRRLEELFAKKCNASARDQQLRSAAFSPDQEDIHHLIYELTRDENIGQSAAQHTYNKIQRSTAW